MKLQFMEQFVQYCDEEIDPFQILVCQTLYIDHLLMFTLKVG